MHKLARAALGAMMLASTAGMAADLAFAAPTDDHLAVIYQREQIDDEMSNLPGVAGVEPPPGVLGVQVRRDGLPDDVRLDMLRAIGQRTDFDRDLAEAPR